MTLHQLLTHTSGIGEYWTEDFEKVCAGSTSYAGWCPGSCAPASTRIRRNFLQDRLRAERRDFGFAVHTLAWASSGCHSAANLMHDLARGVNIPLLFLYSSEPAGGLAFRFQRSGTRMMAHADDMYALNVAPIFPVHPDGVRVAESEFGRTLFEAMWTPYADRPRYGYTTANTFELDPRGPWDRADNGVSGGAFASGTHMSSHVYDKRYRTGGWRWFLELQCSGALTEAELTRVGMPALRPIDELQRRASMSLAAWGGCGAVRAAATAWQESRGDDTWTDP